MNAVASRAVSGATRRISVARDFSRIPGARSIDDGPFPGDYFLRDHLLPAFKLAVDAGDVLVVELDGTEGYATSFLEAAFGGLARAYRGRDIRKNLKLISDSDRLLLTEIDEYIDDVVSGRK